jgi:hypothetical protein
MEPARTMDTLESAVQVRGSPALASAQRCRACLMSCGWPTDFVAEIPLRTTYRETVME